MFKFVFSVYLFSGLTYAFLSDDPSTFTYAVLVDKSPVCIGVHVKSTSDKKFIVTAAQCIYEVQNSRLDVSLGNANFEDENVEPVEQVTIHPYYMPPLSNYDIAILKIKLKTFKNSRSQLDFEGMPLTKLTPIKSQPSSGSPVSLINWDLKAEKKNLTVLTGTVEDRKSCQSKLADYIYVSTKMLCGNFQSGNVPVGSPLLVKDGFVGIFSYYVKGDKGHLPKVFTNVANSEIYSFLEKYI